MTSDIDTLKNAVDSIMHISSSDFELLTTILTSATIKKHDTLLKEGEICKSVFFLTSGFFRMYYIDFEGNEINYPFTDIKIIF